ncbi:TPR domain-containing glycosyltransferase [Radiobacillus deserti]|uniref:Glycosyltransferase n=1 Tax=Radiobacillus deserti TaxID=2594883 RepID=A0A516KIQ1_9BACI|nr:TPR domain-containing glycosyltransferase [Radiobacillus deserti]QDP41277.1 glycosyltransferase [Radiobacillus deserti]
MSNFTVSLCMIVKNEEKYLKRCLDSVKDKVQELVIVDTGSTDKTVEIAESYHAKVYNYEWNNDFAEARNYAITQATSDFILILDADEYIAGDINFTEALQDRYDYYITGIKNFSNNGTVYSHDAIRVFKNGINLSYYGRVHEHLDIEGLNLSHGKLGKLINHDGYQKQVMVEKNKYERNMKLLKLESKENPTGYNLYNLARAYKQNEDYTKAVETFKKAYSLSKKNAILNDLLYQLVDCLRLQGRFEEGMQVCEEAIEVFPDYTDLHYVKGLLFMEAGYLEEAKQAFQKCLLLGEVENGTTREGTGSYLSNYQLALIQEEIGERPDAIEQAFLSLKGNKKIALPFYLDILLKSNVPNNDVVESLNNLFRMDNKEDLLTVVSSAYFIKHPVLTQYILPDLESFEPNIQAVAYMLSKNYEKALETWVKVDSISEVDIPEVLTLLLATNNKVCLKDLRRSINVSDKEWKMLNFVLEGNTPNNYQISIDLQDHLLKVAKNLIILQEYDKFQEFSKIFLVQPIHYQLQLCEILSNFRFDEVVINLLLDIIDKQPNSEKALTLLGEVCFRNGHYGEAVICYERLNEINKKYEYMYRLYKIYEKKNDFDHLFKINDEIKRNYPYSLLSLGN